MTNNQHPDRHEPANLDDLDNVPTYDPKATQSSGLGKFYERYGRSAPQNVEAAPTERQTTERRATERSTAEPTQNLYRVSSEPEPTASFSSHEPAVDAPAVQEPKAYESTPYESAPYEPVMATDTYAEPVTETPVAEGPIADARRGTIDLGLMMLRVVVAALLILHALQTFFQLGGAPGLAGLKEQFSSYAMPEILSIAVPTMQLLAGVFLLFGLLTPIAASIATAVTGFGAIHAIAQADALNALNPGEGIILPALLAALALCLQFTGPGKISLDFARSWARRPLVSSWLWAIVGVAGAIAMWWFLAGVNPLN